MVVGGYVPPSAPRGVHRARGRGRAPARVLLRAPSAARRARAPSLAVPCLGGRSERARRRTRARGLSSLQSDGRRSRPRVHDRCNGNTIKRSTAAGRSSTCYTLITKRFAVGEWAATEREHRSTSANPELNAPKTDDLPKFDVLDCQAYGRTKKKQKTKIKTKKTTRCERVRAALGSATVAAV